MSTNLIYHGFGEVGYLYSKTEYKEGVIRLNVEKKPKYQGCAVCGSFDVIRKGRAIREIRTLPIGKRPVFLVPHLHRLYCKACQSLRLEPTKFARTLAAHRTGILNLFDHLFTTGMVEGINNKIKLLKRQAFGFRDMEYFTLRIYAHHESRYALIG